MYDENSEPTDWIAQLGLSTGNHLESMIAVAEGLLIEIPDMAMRLQRAVASGSAPEVERFAHTLKSSLRYVTNGREVELAQQIEDAGRAGQLQNVPALLDELLPIVGQWRERIGQWLQSH